MVRTIYLPPPIICNPNKVQVSLAPIEQTEEYAADIRGMTLARHPYQDNGFQMRGQFLGKREKNLKRCPRCRELIHVTKPPPGGWPRLKKKREQELDEIFAEQALDAPEEYGYSNLEDLPDRIWVRPGIGIYKAPVARDLSVDCDVTWKGLDLRGKPFPSGPGVWPEPGVLSTNIDLAAFMRTQENQALEKPMTDPTDNPWGLFKVRLAHGEYQWRDLSTKYTKRGTELCTYSHRSEEGNNDISYSVEESATADTLERLRNKEPPKGKCRFHIGELIDSRYTCCNGNVFTPGCEHERSHLRDPLWMAGFGEYWKLYVTPWTVRGHRDAVVMNCGMGINDRGDQELIRVSALDYYSGEVLIDTLVYPSVPMLHLNTRYSGVSQLMLDRARETGNCVDGRIGALERMWDFVGPATTLIVHNARVDMVAIRWIHDPVIDIKELETRRIGNGGCKNLDHLCESLLKRRHQLGYNHDCLRDAIFIRDLCHWYVQNLPADKKINELDEARHRQTQFDQEERDNYYWKPRLQVIERYWIRTLSQIEI